LATIFLRALGLWLNPQIDMKTVSDSILEEVVKNAEFTNAHILKLFYTADEAVVDKGRVYFKVPAEGSTSLVGMRSDEDIKDKKEDVVRKGKKITQLAVKELRRMKVARVEVAQADLEGAFALEDIVNTESGEVLAESNSEIAPAKLQQIIEEGVTGFTLFFPKRDVIGEVISTTLRKDAIAKPVDALLEIYRKM